MNETESGLALKETIKKEKKPDFATLTLESGKDIYREEPDKRNRRGLYAIKGVIPERATIQIRVNFAQPGDFLPCGVLKICDIPNRETKVLNIGLDTNWEIESAIKTKKGLKIRSWVFVNRYSLRHRERRLREAKRPEFKQPQIFNFPKIPKDK